MERLALSVVLCTYNRAAQLRSALDALVEQHGDVAYEVLVIDNNSTDATRAVVQQVADRAGGRVRYAFEGAQGLSNANVTVLNGAEGLNGTVASLASQGLAILRSVTDSLGSNGAGDAVPEPKALDRGKPEQPPAT